MMVYADGANRMQTMALTDTQTNVQDFTTTIALNGAARKRRQTMNELKPCPICGATLKIYSPEDWEPSFYDPDSGGDPYEANCDCGFSFSTGTYDYAEFVAALNRRAQLANDPLTLKQPEMVRCEGCKYFTDKGVCTFYSVFKNDGSYLSMQFMDDDDFCSCGERKDGDSNDE